LKREFTAASSATAALILSLTEREIFSWGVRVLLLAGSIRIRWSQPGLGDGRPGTCYFELGFEPNPPSDEGFPVPLATSGFFFLLRVLEFDHWEVAQDGRDPGREFLEANPHIPSSEVVVSYGLAAV
jgi:hypothetical protein